MKHHLVPANRLSLPDTVSSHHKPLSVRLAGSEVSEVLGVQVTFQGTVIREVRVDLALPFTPQRLL